ncbi:MAG: hypothetical protein ACUVTQ_09365 [Desulfotomaculales bacterium]
MSQEELVRRVVAEVLRRLGQPARGPDILVLLTGGTIGWPQVREGLRALAADGVTFRMVCSRAAARIHKREELLAICPPEHIVSEDGEQGAWRLLRETRGVLVPVLTRKTAARVAALDFAGLIPNLILEALMKGLPVVAARDAADPDHPEWRSVLGGEPHPGLAAALRENLRRVEALGVRLVAAAELEAAGRAMAGAGGVAVPKAHQPGAPVVRGVLTAAEILAAAREGREIRLGPGALVTPLARDVAAEHGVRLLETE